MNTHKKKDIVDQIALENSLKKERKFPRVAPREHSGIMEDMINSVTPLTGTFYSFNLEKYNHNDGRKFRKWDSDCKFYFIIVELMKNSVYVYGGIKLANYLLH